MYRLIDDLGFYTEYSTELAAINAWLDFDYTPELEIIFVP